MPDSLYVVDTHVLVWYLDGDDQLSASAKEILDNPDTRLLIPYFGINVAILTRDENITASGLVPVVW
jgi:PIN domain nuclease of toxin-antitoxin system